jgi:ATP-dependent Lon protease
MTAVKRSTHADGFERASDLTPIALPIRLIAELRKQRDAEELDEADAPTAAKVAGARRTDPDAPTMASTPSKATATPTRPRGAIALFDRDQALRAFEAAKAGRSAVERASLQKKLLGRLLEVGPWRKVAKPGRRWREELAAIGAKYPNASALVELVTSQFALCEKAGRPLSIPPLLLDGPPGIGKTSIARALCDVMQCPMHVVQVETAGHASSLVGVELHWASAGTGALYDALVEGPVINPVILLDELEKVQQRDDYPSLHKPLYALLERDSARGFRDACVPEVALNASHVRWIATSNEVDRIPEAILSRCQVVRVAGLSAAQARQVLIGIDRELRDQYRLQSMAELPDVLISSLALVSPRRMGILLLQLYGRVVLRGDREPSAEDITWLQTQVRESEQAGPKRGTNIEQLHDGEALTELLAVTNVAALKALELRARIDRLPPHWSDLVRLDIVH